MFIDRNRHGFFGILLSIFPAWVQTIHLTVIVSDTEIGTIQIMAFIATRNAVTTMTSQPLTISPAYGVPEEILDALLGHGLDEIGWQQELARQGYQWVKGLRNIIIKRELWFFKDEIERFLAEPSIPTVNGRKFRSNSCRSIHLRIQGKTGEHDQRLREGRLCGPEAS